MKWCIMKSGTHMCGVCNAVVTVSTFGLFTSNHCYVFGVLFWTQSRSYDCISTATSKNSDRYEYSPSLLFLNENSRAIWWKQQQRSRLLWYNLCWVHFLKFIDNIMICIPAYNEGVDAFLRTIQSITRSNYPKDKMYMFFIVDGNKANRQFLTSTNQKLTRVKSFESLMQALGVALKSKSFSFTFCKVFTYLLRFCASKYGMKKRDSELMTIITETSAPGCIRRSEF